MNYKSVNYDFKKLKVLLDEIVRKTSYRSYGTFTAPYDAIPDLRKNIFISGASLPNGDPMYQDIRKIYSFTSHGSYSYHNDSIAVDATMLTSPLLAYIISDILLDKPNSIYDFLNYASNDELIPIENKIDMINKSIDEISNFNTDEKISALESLKNLCEKKKLNQYFNTELLNQFYMEACEIIELRLVSEKNLKNGPKILLKDYKSIK